MEKIRLKNDVEFEVMPMGVDDLSDSRRFKIISTLGHLETLQQFTNTENIETIEYLLSDSSIGITYMDCVGFKNIKYSPIINEEDNTIQDVYIVELSINAVERMLKSMQAKIEKLEQESLIFKQENNVLKEEMLLNDIDADYRLSILELGL